jgi:hypothetical protein
VTNTDNDTSLHKYFKLATVPVLFRMLVHIMWTLVHARHYLNIVRLSVSSDATLPKLSGCHLR